MNDLPEESCRKSLRRKGRGEKIKAMKLNDSLDNTFRNLLAHSDTSTDDIAPLFELGQCSPTG